MTNTEFSNQFDVLYNNITSNQAPGLNEYEKSVFLTKAQDEIVKNYFLPQSNTKQAGFDGNQKRQMDFSMLMKSSVQVTRTGDIDEVPLDYRSTFYEMPTDLFIPVNEVVLLAKGQATAPTNIIGNRQVIPLEYGEYMRLMSKPYKNPLKNQAWRLITQSNYHDSGDALTGKLVEIVLTNTDRKALEADSSLQAFYIIRYVRRPMPIILTDLSDIGDSLTIHGYDGSIGDTAPSSTFYSDGNCCELDPILHEEILQRAVELAKVAWTSNGQDNVQLVMEAGKRSE